MGSGMILVTGATGNVGRWVVADLLAAGGIVRALTRNPERASLPAGVDVVRGDLTQPDRLDAALQGVDRVFLFPAFGQSRALLDPLAASDVRHVVLLSSAAATSQATGAIGRHHAEYEEAVAASGVPWTFLRPGAFMANDLAWAPGITAAGVVRAPFGRAATAPIDERDIAAVAVRALREEGHAGRAYEMTGPQSLTTAERVGLLGEALGREVRFEEMSVEQARERMLARAPASVVDSLMDMFAGMVDRAADVSPTVRDVTGRDPYPYREWAERHAADFSG